MVRHMLSLLAIIAANSLQKIKTLSRSAASFQAPGTSATKLPRNVDPSQHPFERAREYTRALNAVKMERLFAAPFVCQLGDGHVDGVYSFAKDPISLERFASGSGDGVIKIWDLSTRDEIWNMQAHDNIVKGMCWTHDRKLLSCATDKTIKLHDPYNTASGSAPIGTYFGKFAFTSLSHHEKLPTFAASSSEISIYDLSRPTSTPTQTMQWPTSVDTITSIAFNRTETSVLGSVSLDRSVILYDLRMNMPVSKAILTLASNSLAWNPMEAFNFAVASEDHNIYIFDMRKMDRALNVLKDHVAAVMDVEFSPTGEELVSAGYDRTIRLWDRDKGHSRDIYHTRRMQRVFAANFTSDNNYVLSGSDDGNIRLWRTNASSRAGVKSAQQRQALQYADTLKKRYAHMPEIKRISRHRHVPKAVKKAGEIKNEEIKAIKRRDENRRKNSKKGTVTKRAEREKMVLAVVK
ncbi:rRNA-processing protein sof1 [Ascosphaera aggregata]|nr:rRNA-processing protein sof1 [Ascosphaera aggregata]